MELKPSLAICLWALLSILGYEMGKVLLAVLWKYNPLRRPFDLSQRYGPCWAVVTGASSGIGWQYAISLAKRGFNVVLVARRKERLQQLSEVLLGLGVETLVLDRDLSNATPAAIRSLVADMGDRDIGLLVANAGISEINYHFSDISMERNAQLVDLNCTSMVLLLQELLPHLVSRPEGLRSGVVTLGALNASISIPQFGVSAGGKAFIRQFSLAAGKTLDAYVDVMCAHPLAVESEIVKTSADSRLGKMTMICTAEDFCEGTLRHLGRSRETYGCWMYELVHEILLLIPEELSMTMHYSMAGMMSKVLGRSLHKEDLRSKLAQGSSGAHTKKA